MQARRELLLARETVKRIDVEFQELRSDEMTPAEILSDYEIYRNRVQEMLVLHQQRVQRMEPEIGLRDHRESVNIKSKVEPMIIEKSTDVEIMIGEFDHSLAAFDEFVLQELEMLDQQKTQLSEEEALNGLAAEAAAAVARLEKLGIDVHERKAPSLDPEANTENHGVAENSGFSLSEDPEDEKVRSSGRQRAPTRNEEFLGDDDIVARQLREAAESEKDPLLKEKLLKEYHAYKRALRGNRSATSDIDAEDSDKKYWDRY